MRTVFKRVAQLASLAVVAVGLSGCSARVRLSSDWNCYIPPSEKVAAVAKVKVAPKILSGKDCHYKF
jgi:predicted small lipoprotein YifL